MRKTNTNLSCHACAAMAKQREKKKRKKEKKACTSVKMLFGDDHVVRAKEAFYLRKPFGESDDFYGVCFRFRLLCNHDLYD